MPRWAGMITAGLLSLVAVQGASAQEALRELRALNADAHAAEVARQDLLAVQREIGARQDQARTGLVLRELDSARISPPGAAGLMPALPAPTAPLPLDSFTAQMDRMERLTQDALTRSNARIRAVRPASDR